MPSIGFCRSSAIHKVPHKCGICFFIAWFHVPCLYFSLLLLSLLWKQYYFYYYCHDYYTHSSFELSVGITFYAHSTWSNPFISRRLPASYNNTSTVRDDTAGSYYPLLNQKNHNIDTKQKIYQIKNLRAYNYMKTVESKKWTRL